MVDCPQWGYDAKRYQKMEKRNLMADPARNCGWEFLIGPRACNKMVVFRSYAGQP